MCIVSEVKCTSSFTMSFGETFFVIFFNSSWCLSNISLDWSNMDWRLVSICLSLSMNFDKILFVISFSTWVSSDIFSVSYLRITSSFITIFDQNVFVIFFRYSWFLSNVSSGKENMAWRLLSRYLQCSIIFVYLNCFNISSYL